MDKPPPCGIADCNKPATHADEAGVGFCGPHRRDSIAGSASPVSDSNPFDPWWVAATVAGANGDHRFDALDYGVWPS